MTLARRIGWGMGVFALLLAIAFASMIRIRFDPPAAAVAGRSVEASVGTEASLIIPVQGVRFGAWWNGCLADFGQGYIWLWINTPRDMRMIQSSSHFKTLLLLSHSAALTNTSPGPSMPHRCEGP